MQTFRILVHLCFDAATALLYTASIALVTATATVVYSQRLAAGFQDGIAMQKLGRRRSM